MASSRHSGAGGRLAGLVVISGVLAAVMVGAFGLVPVGRDGTAVAQAASPQRLVALGGLDLDRYCRSLGFAFSETVRPRQGQGAAYNNWYCVATGGTLVPIDLLAACKATYAERPITARPTDANDANTWVCYHVVARPAPGPSLGDAGRCHRVLIVGARGSGEDPRAYRGMGLLLYSFAQDVARRLPRTAVAAEGVDYPAVGLFPGQPNFNRTSYANSVREGERSLKRLLAERHRSCPRELWALAGFSQGAEVVGNVLEAGPAGGNQVAAVEMFGDPFFSPDSRSDRGGARGWGVLNPFHVDNRPARSWVSRTESWCNKADIVCQGIGLGHGIQAHGEYPRTAEPGAVTFTVGKLKARL